ncbi:2-carboxy-1,4-naphthoquinone phytyltransferase, chloroplastic-like isoform X2 [Durio zibethinus]|uniref:2-carboxy-1,4-naphthoquinone phytyltransferase, chloroplastic-like isoform X2 n=1 Tax=Durio zibethinus TaxID=66656 RepID=A0A6P5YW77_DURZI|nr:2-carboxy-1,4-naphthoquinone phytyltransferase, chloroplastic-like isoform X2 [Durio zibethinus]
MQSGKGRLKGPENFVCMDRIDKTNNTTKLNSKGQLIWSSDIPEGETNDPIYCSCRQHRDMLKPLAETLSSSCFGSGVGIHHVHFAKQRYLRRSCEGENFPKTLGGSLHFCSNDRNFFQIRRLNIRCPNRQQHIFPKCTSDIPDNTHQEETDVSQATLIWRAIKLPIYSVALVPLTVGGAVAYLQTGLFSARRYIILLASSVLIITWINLSNDVYDFDTGADKNKKESVVNLVGSRSGPLIAAYLSLALGFMGLTWASVDAGNMRSLLLLACAISCGYVYQCPPFRLSYQGLGEPLCFAAFGPFATSAFYQLLGSKRLFTQRECSIFRFIFFPFNTLILGNFGSEIIFLPLTRIVLSASLLLGLTTTLILFCSHFHQVEEDLAIGKMSPLVKMGTERGSVVVKGAVLTLYSLLFALGLCRALPLTCIVLCALTLPIGKLVVSFVEENHKDKGKIFMAKYYCVRLHALFGAAMTAGLVLARMLAK